MTIRDFMQKQFLITGAPTTRKWKIGKIPLPLVTIVSKLFPAR
jgi:hypothetical protein